MALKHKPAKTKAGLSRTEANGHDVIVVPITTLDPEPFNLLKPLPVVIQPCDDQYVATFFDANINASGETQQDAVANLKDLIVTLYRRLTREKKLGRGPAHQLAVLRGVLRTKR